MSLHFFSLMENEYVPQHGVHCPMNKALWNRGPVIIIRCFNKSLYILVLVKRYNIYIYDIVIVVSICVDNILLKMVVLTETCKG
jgi:hypothetical protein